MATRIGIRELRQNLSRALELVRGGETLEVTRNGEPVARIVPAVYPTRLDQLIAEGKATRGRQTLQGYLKAHPPRPSTTGISGSEALDWLRGEE